MVQTLPRWFWYSPKSEKPEVSPQFRRRFQSGKILMIKLKMFWHSLPQIFLGPELQHEGLLGIIPFAFLIRSFSTYGSLASQLPNYSCLGPLTTISNSKPHEILGSLLGHYWMLIQLFNILLARAQERALLPYGVRIGLLNYN